jgi:uncharacterized protein YueI
MIKTKNAKTGNLVFIVSILAHHLNPRKFVWADENSRNERFKGMYPDFQMAIDLTKEVIDVFKKIKHNYESRYSERFHDEVLSYIDDRWIFSNIIVPLKAVQHYASPHRMETLTKERMQQDIVLIYHTTTAIENTTIMLERRINNSKYEALKQVIHKEKEFNAW